MRASGAAGEWHQLSDTIAFFIMAGVHFIVQVWHIRLTIHCLADAGNMLDCACLAGMVAMKHFRRPDVEVIGDEVTIVRLPSTHLYPSTL